MREKTTPDNVLAKVKEKFECYKQEIFLHPLIEHDDGDVNQTRKRNQLENRNKLVLEISNAIDKGANEIVCFQIQRFRSDVYPDSVDTVRARVTLLLYKKSEKKMVDIVLLNGNLPTKMDEHANVIQLCIQTDMYSSAYLFAEVIAPIAGNRRRSTVGSDDMKACFGVKPVGLMQDGKFAIHLEDTQITLIGMDDPSLTSLDFDIKQLAKWNRSPDYIDAVWKRISDVSKKCLIPSVYYEISIIHKAEDWKAVHRRKTHAFNFTKQRPGIATVTFLAASSEGTTPLIFSSFGYCPLTLKKYKKLDDHLDYLNRRFHDLQFTVNEKRKNGIDVALSLIERAPYKNQTWPDGKVDMDYIPGAFEQIPVAFKTGPEGLGTWVRHKIPKSNNQLMQDDAIRRLENMETLTDDTKKLGLIINKFMMEYDFGGTQSGDIRWPMKKLFDEKKEEIVKNDLGLYAALLSAKLFQKEIFTAEDNAKVFDRYLDAILIREEEKAVLGLSPTSIYLDNQF